MPETTTKAEYYVGVDLGGTKILTGVFDEKLACLGRTKMSTKSERGAEGVPIERVQAGERADASGEENERQRDPEPRLAVTRNHAGAPLPGCGD